MALKKPSQAAAVAAKAKPDAAAVEALAEQLADRPYGEPLPVSTPAAVENSKPAPKARPISISLPPDVIAALEDQVIQNKRSGEGPRTVSGLIKLALRHYGYKI